MIFFAFSGECVAINSAGVQLLGQSEKELFGHQIAEVFAPNINLNWTNFGSRKQISGEAILRCADGAARTTKFVAYANVTESAHLLTICDITEQAKRERIAEHMISIVEANEDAIFSCDQQLKIVSWNHSAER